MASSLPNESSHALDEALESDRLQTQIDNALSDELAKRGPVHLKIRQSRTDSSNLHAMALDRLRRLGIEGHVIRAASLRTKLSGAPLVHELASSGQLDLCAYYQLLANDLDLPFETAIDAARIMVDISAAHFRPGRTAQIFCRNEKGILVLYVAPDLRLERQLSALFLKSPDLKSRFCICEPSTIIAAMEIKLSAQAVAGATKRLHEQMPELSARETLVPWQAFCLGLLVALLPVGLYSMFWQTIFAIHVIAVGLFSVCVAIRVFAWLSLLRAPIPGVLVDPSGGVPMYSVMIALHKEALVVPQLVRAMARIEWPTSRLEVLYVCEADDLETIAALQSLRLPAAHRIVKVPASLPRTKPKALNYALELSTGDFVVIYDAEDRPHRMQLVEAWQRFSSDDEDLACLQAPLDISNADQNWLARHFAFEYAAHFHGLLPYLEKVGMPLPLGGTSNHFRRAVLDNILAWDPYNVTEDADLGIRLYRFGYRCGVLHLPTLEDAPSKISQWIPQRTRWIKGWMQTFLVQNRKYNELGNKIGLFKNAIFQILMAGFILSPLLYGISLFAFIAFIFSNGSMSEQESKIIYFDLAIFLMGHLGFMLLGITCWKRSHNKPVLSVLSTLPVYWLLATVAAWRSIWKLIVAPHQWEKTSHQIAYKQSGVSGGTETQSKV